MDNLENQYLQLRQEILDNYFSDLEELEKAECRCNRVTVKLPVRVNISGTWTDAMPYCTQCGGQVVNMAVLVEGEMPVEVRAEKTNSGCIELISEGKRCVIDQKLLSGSDSIPPDFMLHFSALRVLGFTDKTELCGIKLETSVSSIDRNSGLGVSSILLGGCIIALSRLLGISLGDKNFLNMIFVAEQVMGTGGGWQDQAGGLTPSVKINTSLPGTEQYLNIQSIKLSPEFSELLNRRLVIIPTGIRHTGKSIVTDVMKRYISGNTAPFEEIRELNSDVVSAFTNGDIEELSDCLNRHNEILKKLSPFISNDKTEYIAEFCRKYVDGISILGAGGGGYFFAVLSENTDIACFRKDFSEKFADIESEIKHISVCREIAAVGNDIQTV